MIKKTVILFCLTLLLNGILFSQETEEKTEKSENLNVTLETGGKFSQSFASGIIDSDINPAFDSEAFESITQVSGNASIIFGVYALSFEIRDKFTTYYLTSTELMSYKNKVTGIIGNNFYFNPNFKFFANFETDYETIFLTGTSSAGTLELAPVIGVAFIIEMFEFSITEKVPFTIDLDNSTLSLIEIDGLYQLAFHSGFGLDAVAFYNVIAPVDPQGQTSADPEQKLRVIAEWPIKALVPQAGLVMYSNSDKTVWGFYAGMGIRNELWQINGGYQGGYNIIDNQWENLFSASFSLSM